MKKNISLILLSVLLLATSCQKETSTPASEKGMEFSLVLGMPYQDNTRTTVLNEEGGTVDINVVNTPKVEFGWKQDDPVTFLFYQKKNDGSTVFEKIETTAIVSGNKLKAVFRFRINQGDPNKPFTLYALHGYEGALNIDPTTKAVKASYQLKPFTKVAINSETNLKMPLRIRIDAQNFNDYLSQIKNPDGTFKTLPFEHIGCLQIVRIYNHTSSSVSDGTFKFVKNSGNWWYYSSFTYKVANSYDANTDQNKIEPFEFNDTKNQLTNTDRFVLPAQSGSTPGVVQLIAWVPNSRKNNILTPAKRDTNDRTKLKFPYEAEGDNTTARPEIKLSYTNANGSFENTLRANSTPAQPGRAYYYNLHFYGTYVTVDPVQVTVLDWIKINHTVNLD